MNPNLSVEQQILKTSARDFLTDKYPRSFVREMEKDEKGYSPELWQEIADLGWMGLIFPEEYGGADMSFLDLHMLLEEMGRACFPGPFFSTVILGGLSILNNGSKEQKQKYLPEIINGKAIFTMAILEPKKTNYEAASIYTKATAKKDGYVINGTKLFVPDAHIADYILCITRTEDSAEVEDGITVFIVDAKSSGISTTVLSTIANDKQCKVVFNNVKIPRENILGELNSGWKSVQKVVEVAALMKCCEMMGIMEAVLAMTVEYVKNRIQFNVPIGSNQAVQWHCVAIAEDVDSCRAIINDAVWKLSTGRPCSYEIAMAKAWVSEACEHAILEGTQAHGGVSIIQEHDMPLYFRRAKAAELLYGDGRFHRKIVAQTLGFKTT